MPLPTLANLGAAILAGYRAAAGTAAVPDDAAHLRLMIETGTGGTHTAAPEQRDLAVRGLDAMRIRHPERLAKITAAALGDEIRTFRAVGVLAEYARTRRHS